MINYDAIDVAGNVASTVRTVNVTFSSGADTTSPSVLLVGSGTINILSGSLYVDSGATWSDNVD